MFKKFSRHPHSSSPVKSNLQIIVINNTIGHKIISDNIVKDNIMIVKSILYKLLKLLFKFSLSYKLCPSFKLYLLKNSSSSSFWLSLVWFSTIFIIGSLFTVYLKLVWIFKFSMLSKSDKVLKDLIGKKISSIKKINSKIE